MITTTFKKAISDVAHLQAHLRANGITKAAVQDQPGVSPNLTIYHDAENDPTELVDAYQIPDYFVASSNKDLVNGVPEAKADGVDVHSVTITKRDGVTKSPKGSGTETVKIIATNPIMASPNPASLSNGAVVINFGPVTMVGEWFLRIEDDEGNVIHTPLRLRFV